MELSEPALGAIDTAPALAVDGDGDGLAAFVAGGAVYAVKLPATGGEVSRVQLDTAGVAADTPVLLSLAATGTGHAFWTSASGAIEGVAHDPATGFGPAETYLGALDRLFLSALDVDPEGDAAVGFAYYDANQARWNLGHAIRDAATDWRPAEDWAIQRVAISHLALARVEPYLSLVAAWVDHLGRPWASAIDVDRRTGLLAQTSGVPLDLGAAGTHEDLRVAFDGASHAHAAWRRVADDGEHVEVQRRLLDQTWTGPESLGDAAPGHAPVLATPRDGPGAAVAFVDTTGALQVSRLDDTGWHTDRVYAAASPIDELSIAFSPGGGLHVAFVEGGALLAASLGDGGWEAAFVVDTGPVAAPVVRAGGANVHLVWLRTAAGSTTVMAARR